MGGAMGSITTVWPFFGAASGVAAPGGSGTRKGRGGRGITTSSLRPSVVGLCDRGGGTVGGVMFAVATGFTILAVVPPALAIGGDEPGED